MQRKFATTWCQRICRCVSDDLACSSADHVCLLAISEVSSRHCLSQFDPRRRQLTASVRLLVPCFSPPNPNRRALVDSQRKQTERSRKWKDQCHVTLARLRNAVAIGLVFVAWPLTVAARFPAGAFLATFGVAFGNAGNLIASTAANNSSQAARKHSRKNPGSAIMLRQETAVTHITQF